MIITRKNIIGMIFLSNKAFSSIDCSFVFRKDSKVTVEKFRELVLIISFLPSLLFQSWLVIMPMRFGTETDAENLHENRLLKNKHRFSV